MFGSFAGGTLLITPLPVGKERCADCLPHPMWPITSRACRKRLTRWGMNAAL
jgi:hypothetical protein